MKPQPIVGTVALRAAIRNKKQVQLTGESIFEWSDDENRKVLSFLSAIDVDIEKKTEFLNALARLMIRNAVLIKWPFHELRDNPKDPYSPRQDIANIEAAINGIEKARTALRRLSMDWGLKNVPLEVHGQVESMLSTLKAACSRIRDSYPSRVDGKAAARKRQKLRIALEVAQAYRKYLQVNPTSTINRPYQRIFYYVISGLGFKTKGRWFDYYTPVFIALGLERRA